MEDKEPLGSSFRDPSGFVFRKFGIIFRQVNPSYLSDYGILHSSGLYDELIEHRLLIPHEEVDVDLALTPGASKVIKPKPIPFISYPYEWCFSQLREAALATLEIQKRALTHGMSLKDATAYNMQYWQGKSTLIDTLSFETYREGEPWVAYGQFCRHFIAPLVLMSHVDVRLNRLTRSYIDGLPLDLAGKLAPWRTKWNLHIAAHLHMHARRVTVERKSAASVSIGLNGLRGILDSLESLIKGLSWHNPPSTWKDYYSETNYTESAMQEKFKIVDEMLDSVSPQPSSVWDLGANNGRFSELASRRGIPTVAWDLDASAIENCYQGVIKRQDPCLLPLIQDLANPSPGLGWAHHERESLSDRGPADLILALALVHHLAIGNNVPLPEVASFLASIGKSLIIEFVPKEDSQVQRLLSQRQDIFDNYTQGGFEESFKPLFETTSVHPIQGTNRTLYLMRRRNDP